MKRYLLFDSGCSICSKLAHNIEEIAEGWLVARSLGERSMQTLLKNDPLKYSVTKVNSINEPLPEPVEGIGGSGKLAALASTSSAAASWECEKLLLQSIKCQTGKCVVFAAAL